LWRGLFESWRRIEVLALPSMARWCCAMDGVPGFPPVDRKSTADPSTPYSPSRRSGPGSLRMTGSMGVWKNRIMKQAVPLTYDRS
jgi:hypothetical protein